MTASLPEPDARSRRSDGAAGDEGPRRALVDWAVAERVATWAIARRPPSVDYDPAVLSGAFAEATAQAEQLVSAATGWRAPTPARSVVTDRAGWARANVASFQRLLAPVLVKFERRKEEKKAERRRVGGLPSWLVDLPEPIAGTIAGAGRSVSGAELGAVLAWMSTRVLGQYDMLLTEDMAETQDLLYYVGPNVVELEERHGFPPEEFRLWLALHEVTHRCQFTAIPWMRDYFVSLVREGLGSLDPDPSRFAEALRRMAEEIRAGRNPLRDNGALGLVATPEQLEGLHRIQALMSLLEGHGDVTMDRAGAAVIPHAARFGEVLRQRRNQTRGLARLLQQLIGMEAKFRQYEEGERFIAAVEESGGPELLDRAWRGPEWLPSLAEIRDPSAWIARVGAAPAFTG